jgi:hypothetical protein
MSRWPWKRAVCWLEGDGVRWEWECPPRTESSDEVQSLEDQDLVGRVLVRCYTRGIGSDAGKEHRERRLGDRESHKVGLTRILQRGI